MSKKKGFILHKDSLVILDKMTDEQAGKFLKIIYQYQISGTIPKLDFAMKMAIMPFINQFKRDDECYLYAIRLSSDDECFDKIGISSNLEKRFSSFRALGYILDELQIVKYKTREEALNQENSLQKFFWGSTYTPKKDFGGQYECFYKGNIDFDISKPLKHMDEPWGDELQKDGGSSGK